MNFRYRLRAAKIKAWDGLLDFVLKHHPMARNSNIVSYAEDELRRSDWTNPDAFYGDLMPKAVMRQARLFSIEGHSGMSAGIANKIASDVCMFRPLTPLTGEPDEWAEVGDGDERGAVFQNKRMSSVFKEGEDGTAYWIEGRVFREPSGACFTSRDSRVNVSFPWMPPERPEYIDVETA